jgi:nitrite reductase/ring-hydroxylating ferredoxin subunit
MNVPNWIRVLDVDALVPSKGTTVRAGGKQIALFRTDSGEVHAVENRCPHEGYPLAAGTVRGGLLTCEWHNWKFQLGTGTCVLGGEDVRAYPVRIQEGGVWLDLADPAPKADAPRVYHSLEKAVDEEDLSHGARAIQRLLAAGEPPERVLAWACSLAAHRSRYGFDHGLATAADIVALFRELPAENDVLLVQALDLVTGPHVRRPRRSFGAAERTTSLEGVEDELRRRIEAEEVEGAEALFRGALEAGASAKDVFRWLVHAVTDHFIDFGHGQIFVVKAEELIASLGWSLADPILTSVVSMIAYGTREDRLPYMRSYMRAMEAYAGRFAEWAAMRRSTTIPFDVESFVRVVLEGTLEGALAEVANALSSGVPTDRIARALALSSAHRLWRFDARIEDQIDSGEGWLDVTHQLTHADAVHETEKRRPSSQTLRALFHSARFIQHTQVLDRTREEHSAIPPPDPDLAQRSVRALTSEQFTMPIFVDHHIKTVMAAKRVTEALETDPLFASRPDRQLALAASARFASGRLRERRINRRTLHARSFVREGKLHKKRLGY